MPVAYAAAAYRQTGVVSRALEANPHQLIAQLLGGTLERIRLARALIVRGERARKAEAIRSAAAIVDGLRMSLDRSNGGAIAERLDALYEYIGQRLLEANATDDVARLDECERLLGTIDSAWAQLPQSKSGP
jgi:flagellar protein FliS